MLSLAAERFLEVDAARLLGVYKEAYTEVSKELHRPNVLITGITGSGKSSLINALFHSPLAPVGAGQPITQHFVRYAPEDQPIVLYDSRGLEAGKAEDFIQSTQEFFQEHSKTEKRDISNFVVWYIVNSAMARFQEFEKTICTRLFQNVPIVFILNKSDLSTEEQREAIRKEIKGMGLDNCFGVIDTMCAPKKEDYLLSFDECPFCKSDDIVIKRKEKVVGCKKCGKKKSLIRPNGLIDVVKTTIEILPVLAREAFVVAQQVSFHMKEDLAKKIILDMETKLRKVHQKAGLLKATATMLTRLSIVWQFREHGTIYGADVAKSFAKSLTFRDTVLLFLHHHQQHIQKALALGILWNRCVRKLALILFQDTLEIKDEEDFQQLMKRWTQVVHSAFEELGEEQLGKYEDKIEKQGVTALLDEEMPPHEDESIVATPLVRTSGESARTPTQVHPTPKDHKKKKNKSSHKEKHKTKKGHRKSSKSKSKDK